MKTDIETLQDLVKISYEEYADSRAEAAEVLDMFHNRQYDQAQLATLSNRGQPAETFNIIKLMGRLLLGYYSTVVNTVKVSPRNISDILTSSLLNDTLDFTMADNRFETEGDKIKLDGILTGLMGCSIDVEDTEEVDQFKRKIRRIEIEHVPERELLLDPMSTKEDYSDGMYLHRLKWMREEALKKLLRSLGIKNPQELIDKLDAYYNHLNIEGMEFEDKFTQRFDGYFKRYNNYLIVHTIIEDDDERRWSILWSADQELSRKEITFKEVKFPYRIHKIHTSDQVEYYGIFREIVETQKAINQALLKIQLMVNTQKAFVEGSAVEDIDKFTDQFNRVNAVIEVKRLSGIKVENLTREVLDQYTVIDKALDRIKAVLGVNDSFLGMAFASDSGRKVKLQQNATSLALRYISVRMEQFYRLLGWDIVHLIKQYYTAHQVLRIADESVGERWVAINQPMQVWSGRMDANQQPIMENVWEEVLDPATGEPMEDDNGNVIIAPIPTSETEIAFTNVDLSIDSTIYNDEDEKNQLMLETVLTGNIGQHLSTVNPAGFFKAAALTVKSMKSKHSIDIAEILNQTAEVMMQTGAPMPPKDGDGNDSKSKSLKLPQNTNEG